MRRPLLLLPLLVACSPSSGSGGDAACGIMAVAGPTLVLSEFNTPGAALTHPPDSLPGRLVARFVASSASPAIVGRRGDSLEIGVDGPVPKDFLPGFGVLVLATSARPLGVFVFQGTPILNAPVLGRLTAGATRAPLIGLTIDPTKVESPTCPFFPDSLRQ